MHHKLHRRHLGAPVRSVHDPECCLPQGRNMGSHVCSWQAHSGIACKSNVCEVMHDQDQGLVWPCASRQAVDFAYQIQCDGSSLCDWCPLLCCSNTLFQTSLLISLTFLRFNLCLQIEPQHLHANGRRALFNPKASVLM